MNAETLSAFLAQWLPVEERGPHGEIQQRERIQAVAEFVALEHAGDFVEIGCLHGSTTVLLADVARRFGRRVLAIDPFELGTQNCFGGEFEIFMRTIEPYADVIDFYRLRSDDPHVIQELARREIALAFVDGLHTYDTCLGDIKSVGHATVIAVDDTLWSAEVRKAFEDGAALLRESESGLVLPQFRESWIV